MLSDVCPCNVLIINLDGFILLYAMRNIKGIKVLKSQSLDRGMPVTSSNEGKITELRMHLASSCSSSII